MSFIRKTRYFSVFIMLSLFLFFSVQATGNGNYRESVKSGEAVKLVPGDACSKEFLEPSLYRLHVQVLPAIKNLFQSSVSVHPVLMTNPAEKESVCRYSVSSAPGGLFILRYICKIQV